MIKRLLFVTYEKANLLNAFFANVGIGISRNPSCTRKAVSNDFFLFDPWLVSRKMQALKPNKAAVRDCITPKLLGIHR